MSKNRFNWNKNANTYVDRDGNTYPQDNQGNFSARPGEKLLPDGSIVPVTNDGATVDSQQDADESSGDFREGENAEYKSVKAWFRAMGLQMDGAITGNEVQLGAAPVPSVSVAQLPVTVQASLASAKLSLALPAGLGTITVGVGPGGLTIGANLQGLIHANHNSPAGSPQQIALTQKIETNFGAALESRGTSAPFQISAGNAALSAGVSFGFLGVLNMSINLNGKVTNNAQNVKISNKVTKPEGTHAPRSNIAMNVSKGVAGLALSAQVGSTSGVSIQTTLGTNYGTATIGVSGTKGSYKIATAGKGISYAAEPIILEGITKVIEGKSNIVETGGEEETPEEEQETITDDTEQEMVDDYSDFGDFGEDDDMNGNDNDMTSDEAEDESAADAAEGDEDDDDSDDDDNQEYNL